MVGKLRDQPEESQLSSWRQTRNHLLTKTQIKPLPASFMHMHTLTRYTAILSLNEGPKGHRELQYRALIKINSNKCNPRSAY